MQNKHPTTCPFMKRFTVSMHALCMHPSVCPYVVPHHPCPVSAWWWPAPLRWACNPGSAWPCPALVWRWNHSHPDPKHETPHGSLHDKDRTHHHTSLSVWLAPFFSSLVEKLFSFLHSKYFYKYYVCKQYIIQCFVNTGVDPCMWFKVFVLWLLIFCWVWVSGQVWCKMWMCLSPLPHFFIYFPLLVLYVS